MSPVNQVGLLLSIASAREQDRSCRRRRTRHRRWLHGRRLSPRLLRFRRRDGSRLLRRRWRHGRHLLSDVVLSGPQRRDVLGHLLLPGRELFYAAPYVVESGRQRFKLRHRVSRSCSHDWRRLRNGKQPGQGWKAGYQHLPRRITVGLPRKRGTDTDENRNKETSKGSEYSSANRRTAAGQPSIRERGRMKRMDRRIRGPCTNALIVSVVQIAHSPAR
jgi:hypothetical protein